MVPNFSHSISLTITKSQRRGGTAANHIRSASFPCQSHPLITDLEDKIRAVQSWITSADASVAMIKTGLTQIELLVTAINDCIKLMKTMLQHDATTECLLETFLCIIDSYGSVLSDIVVLKQLHFEAQSALRRHDSTLLSSSLRSQKRIEKHLNRVSVSLRKSIKYLSVIMDCSNAAESKIFGAVRDAVGVMSSASAVLINRIVAMLAASARPFKKKISNGDMKMLIHVRFEELEEFVRIVESGCEKVLRSLVNCRVALLNIQSNSF